MLELEKTLPTAYAKDIAPLLADALVVMKADPARFVAFNPTNGWGGYDMFIPWIERYLEACRAYPDAEIQVSR